MIDDSGYPWKDCFRFVAWNGDECVDIIESPDAQTAFVMADSAVRNPNNKITRVAFYHVRENAESLEPRATSLLSAKIHS